MTSLSALVTGFLVVKTATMTLNALLLPVLGRDPVCRRRATATTPADAVGHRPVTDRGEPDACVPEGTTTEPDPAEPDPAEPHRGEPDPLAEVSLLVPVRDESARVGDYLPAMLEQGAGEVFVLDDRSSDDTAERVEAIIAASGLPPERARLLRGEPRPSGWVGKTWACQQLADAARGDTLLFVDCDVTLAPGAVRAAANERRRQRADVFSVFARQRTRGLGQRAVLPCIDDVLLAWLPYPLLRAPIPAAATAMGAFVMADARTYRLLGGHAAVRGEIVEDVALARHTRRRGHTLGLALGGDLVGVTMYADYPEMVRGLGRGLLPVAGGSRAVLAALWLWHALAYSAPWVLAARDRRWLGLAAIGVAQRLLLEATTTRRRWADAALVPAIPVLAAPVVVQAMRRSQTWRGETY